MKKSVLLLTILFSLNLSALEKIELNTTPNPSSSSYDKKASSILGDAFSPLTTYNSESYKDGEYENGKPLVKVRTKLELVKNKAKYKKEYEAYSVIGHNKEDLKDWLYMEKIPPFAFEYSFGFADTIRELRISAFGYDWGDRDPAKAQNFYDILVSHKDIKFGDKIHAADFFFRTGQIKKVKRILTNSTCSISIKGQYLCHYYRGLAIYLITGNNRNQSLNIASRRYSQAKAIYGARRW